MKTEMDDIKSMVEASSVKRISGIDFTEGRIGDIPVVVATSGVGKVFASMCAQTMILVYGPDMIINVGIAGSLTPELNIGDIAVAEDVVQHDMDTTGAGDPPGMISGINKIKLPCDPDTVTGLMQSATDLGMHCLKGTIASADIFVQQKKLKESIVKKFGAISCEMEGAGIGQVCYVNKVPFCVIRAISDNGDENATGDYDMSLAMAADRATRVLLKFLDGLHRFDK